jgi:hypothetical protein
MGGWLGTATPEKCAHCGQLAILWICTRRCDLCETDAFDLDMMRKHSWYVPLSPRLRALATAHGGVTSC